MAQLLVQLPNYLRRCRYRFLIDWRHPGLISLGILLGPVIVGSAVGQVNLLFDKFFASTLQPGNIAAMQYATKVVGFPQQLFAVAIATVIFPILSAQFATNELRSLRTTAFSGLRMTALITIPAALALIALARPIISVLFERGEFTPGDVVRTAGAMQFYAIGLLGLAASIVLTRCFFAMHDSRTPVLVATAVMVMNVICSALTVGHFGINGLAASNSLSSLTEAAALTYLFGRRIGGIGGELLRPSFSATFVASAAMALTAWAVSTALWHVTAPFWQHALTLLGAMLAGSLVFVAAASFLRIPELGTLLALLNSRVFGAPPPHRRGIDGVATSLSHRLNLTRNFLIKQSKLRPKAAIVLGSGLSSLTESAQEQTVVAYKDIPHFLTTSVAGHRGRLIFGRVGGTPVLIFDGRVHFYEGLSMQQVAYPVYVAKSLGVSTFLATNAAGGINQQFSPGDIMLIRDHINFTGDSPLRGPNVPELGVRFPNMRTPTMRS